MIPSPPLPMPKDWNYMSYGHTQRKKKRLGVANTLKTTTIRNTMKFLKGFQFVQIRFRSESAI